MKKFIIIFFIFILAGLIFISLYFIRLLQTPLQINYTLFEINSGDTGKKIARSLFENELIIDDKLFYFLMRYRQLDRNIKAGTYLFSGDYTMLDVLEKIVSGEILVKRTTIPEGLSIYRTMKILSDNEIGEYEKLLLKAKDPIFAREITGLNIETLEGFLYPDTYVFGYDMSEESIIRYLVTNFFHRLSEAGIYIENEELFYKDLILASIVEKEAIFNDEKPLIAGVFLNRLKRNMRLQADPTAVYHLEPEFIHRSRVTYADLRTETPFNTYQINGLPPHPICSPSISAISAVQNPTETDFLFFFADGTGRHTFSRTYEEHSRKLRQMRNARR